MATDQYTLSDPTKLYSDIDTSAQYQSGPGLDAELENKADLGEKTYRGTGRLTGRKALVTGGDSGIGGRRRSRSPARAPTSPSPTCRAKRRTPSGSSP